MLVEMSRLQRPLCCQPNSKLEAHTHSEMCIYSRDVMNIFLVFFSFCPRIHFNDLEQEAEWPLTNHCLPDVLSGLKCFLLLALHFMSWLVILCMSIQLLGIKITLKSCETLIFKEVMKSRVFLAELRAHKYVVIYFYVCWRRSIL